MFSISDKLFKINPEYAREFVSIAKTNARIFDAVSDNTFVPMLNSQNRVCGVIASNGKILDATYFGCSDQTDMILTPYELSYYFKAICKITSSEHERTLKASIKEFAKQRTEQRQETEQSPQSDTLTRVTAAFAEFARHIDTKGINTVQGLLSWFDGKRAKDAAERIQLEHKLAYHKAKIAEIENQLKK